ncbi:hypothetical protein O0I10_005399 [Lichtheimia ornata]|uniref:Uncharacterized protein n=1 Tax=Lichtheimia ornata TaxID=688661 RepID=A0AAD7Y1Q5_9FUNG|nr:uncharacterized protein O0I10_005399 [Lichtheimia ornata]KAJ8659017.1 hypothetical protein O0I10_005399 [Lichtheimia ornata]
MSPNPIQKQTTKKSERASLPPEVAKPMAYLNAVKKSLRILMMETLTPWKSTLILKRRKSKDDDEDSLQKYAESVSDEDMVIEKIIFKRPPMPLGSEISSGKIGPNTPYVMRSYCQQEADKCDRQMKAAIAASDDKSFDELLSKQKERWLLKSSIFLRMMELVLRHPRAKSQGKKALKDIVHLPTVQEGCATLADSR